jgi:hypothetical protein
MSSINFVLKFVVIVFVVMAEKSSLQDTLPPNLSAKLQL